jgi:hypothetical protein
MGFALARLICIGFVITALLVFGALLLRLAISVSNRLLGASSGKNYDPDEDELDEWIGYRQIRHPSRGIPELGLGKGMVCVLLMGVIDLVFGLIIGFLSNTGPHHHFHDEEITFVVFLIGLIFSFPLSAWVLSGMLPTRFGRACLVLVMNYLIIIALIGSLFGLLYFLRVLI